MIESEVVNEWQALARIDQAVTLLVSILESKFGKVPPEVEAKIRGTSELNQLKIWVTEAAKIPTLDEFRKAAGL